MYTITGLVTSRYEGSFRFRCGSLFTFRYRGLYTFRYRGLLMFRYGGFLTFRYGGVFTFRAGVLDDWPLAVLASLYTSRIPCRVWLGTRRAE